MAAVGGSQRTGDGEAEGDVGSYHQPEIAVVGPVAPQPTR